MKSKEEIENEITLLRAKEISAQQAGDADQERILNIKIGLLLWVLGKY